MLAVRKSCSRRLVSSGWYAPATAHRQSSTISGTAAASSRSMGKTIFSGIQPTGVPHLGNYLGALKNWVKLQDTADEEDKVIFSIVDLHAITVPQNPALLRRSKREMLASLLAIGLSPAKSIIYEQSTVPEHTELSWLLSTMAPLGALNRMTQFKSKGRLSGDSDASSDHLMLGLFAYPVLQAADILLYKSSLVPVGEDQSQHLELSRALARAFNARVQQKVFPIPATLLSTASARISDLRDPTKKMSKSAVNPKSRISILDDESAIRKKIASAMTDGIAELSYDPINRPGVSNLLEIYAAFIAQSDHMDDVVHDMRNTNMQSFKKIAAEAVISGLEPIREKYLAFNLDTERGRQNLDDISAGGTQKAKIIAQHTMEEVRMRMGLR